MSRNNGKHWKWGVFYHNPENPKIWVEQRFGWGYTLNMAKPVSWGILAVFLLAILALIQLTT